MYLTLLCSVIASAVGVYLHLLWNIGGYITILGCIGCLIGLFATPTYQERKRLGLVMGSGLLHGATVIPLIDLAIEIDPSVLVSAFVGIALAFGCFSGAAMFARRRKYLYLGGSLSSGLAILMWLHSASSIFGGSTAMFLFELYFGLLVFAESSPPTTSNVNQKQLSPLVASSSTPSDLLTSPPIAPSPHSAPAASTLGFQSNAFEFQLTDGDGVLHDKHLHLPQHHKMVATYRCDEILKEKHKRFAEHEIWRAIREPVSFSRTLWLGEGVASLCQQLLTEYDSESTHYDGNIRYEKRLQLERNLLQDARPVFESLWENIKSEALADFKEAFEKALKKKKNIDKAAESCKATSFEKFRKESAALASVVSKWNTTEASMRQKDKESQLQKDIAAYIGSRRSTYKSPGQTSKYLACKLAKSVAMNFVDDDIADLLIPDEVKVAVHEGFQRVKDMFNPGTDDQPTTSSSGTGPHNLHLEYYRP